MTVVNRLEPYADIEINESLKKHTTYRIGGNCKYFIYPKNEMCLVRIMSILKEENIPVKVFGKGSNILCSDDDFEGAIICLDRYFTDFYFEEDGTCLVSAGMSIILLTHEAMKKSLTGLEFASGIPGTVGGALFMNAGAYKSDMSNIVEEAYVLKGNSIHTMKKDELDFSYRHSIFQKHPDWIVLGCKLHLQKGNQQDILDLMDSRRKRRMTSQPLDKPCAGSVFRNPADHQAWQLIEEIGLRGKQIGGAVVSNKHANFIVNEKNAKATDVAELIELIQKNVKERFGIDMITEVERFNWKK